MKTRDELFAVFGDELSGLLLAALHACEDQPNGPPLRFTMRGKFFTDQLRRSRNLLARIHLFMTNPEPNNGEEKTFGCQDARTGTKAPR